METSGKKGASTIEISAIIILVVIIGILVWRYYVNASWYKQAKDGSLYLTSVGHPPSTGGPSKNIGVTSHNCGVKPVYVGVYGGVKGWASPSDAPKVSGSIPVLEPSEILFWWWGSGGSSYAYYDSNVVGTAAYGIYQGNQPSDAINIYTDGSKVKVGTCPSQQPDATKGQDIYLKCPVGYDINIKNVLVSGAPTPESEKDCWKALSEASPGYPQSGNHTTTYRASLTSLQNKYNAKNSATINLSTNPDSDMMKIIGKEGDYKNVDSFYGTYKGLSDNLCKLALDNSPWVPMVTCLYECSPS